MKQPECSGSPLRRVEISPWTVPGLSETFSFKPKQPVDAITHNKPKKLTDKQIQFFANKLAHHDPFASKKAAVGESYADLEKRLLIELQDVEFVRKYAGVLKELGLDV